VNAGEPELVGQTVVVIGGSAGIGLETARRARLIAAGFVDTGLSASTAASSLFPDERFSSQ
jgi:NAD(P)-dependent dehydrogenase (short-subunit alcohol dehydrogenase family)